ncbi:MAG: hypothetical protein Q8L10_00270 [Candidatus Moranbacteria bacterium]|nr:hypothetical protein [Candidatus Moranbacteria bacterium]
MKTIIARIGMVGLLFLAGFAWAVFPPKVPQVPVHVAVADDGEEDEEHEEDERDEDEEHEDDDEYESEKEDQPIVEEEDEVKIEYEFVTQKLPDTVVDTVVEIPRYDSDGDGLYDDEDPHPDINEFLIVKDDNLNGLDDRYER